MTNMPAIQISGLGKSLGRLQILHDVSLCAEIGQHVMICGGRGAGKAMLLRCMNGMTDFQKGSIRIFGAPFRDDPDALIRLRQTVGMLVPEIGLFGHLTVMGNCVWGPERILGHDPDRAEAEARAMLSRLGIAALAELVPARLDAAERLRVGLARALLMGPDMLLLDDPLHDLAAADAVAARALLAGLLPELQAEGVTIISAMNDPGLALATADQMIFLDRGHVVECATPQQFLTAPQSRAGRDFVAAMLADPVAGLRDDGAGDHGTDDGGAGRIRAETSPDS